MTVALFDAARTARIPTEVWTLPRPRRDKYVGAFPLHFEQRLHRLLGSPEKVLHPFGGLAEIGERIDLNPTTGPDWVGNAHDLTKLLRPGEAGLHGAEHYAILDESYDLVICDPPYSAEESEILYGTPPPRWGQWTAEAVRVCKTGGHVVVYLDKQPERPKGTRLVHRIVVLTRTWHRARICFVFEKDAGAT